VLLLCEGLLLLLLRAALLRVRAAVHCAVVLRAGPSHALLGPSAIVLGVRGPWCG